jgi:tricorn protease
LTREPGNEFSNAMTPGGDRIIFTATAPSAGLYSVKWDGSDAKKLGPTASVQHASLTGDKIVLVTGSQAATTGPAGGGYKTVAINDRIRIDLAQQSSQMFLETSYTLDEQYYHPTMNGRDWPALTRQYHDLALKARTNSEFSWVANQFIGELGGSHLGMYGSGFNSPISESLGRLGTFHQRVDGGFEVLGIIDESPAAKGPMALEVGDIITAVEFEPIGEDQTLEMALKGRLGEETAITILRAGDGDEEPAELTVLLTPTSWGEIRSLRYQQWRLDNARLVDELSGGRLGYIHVQSMNQPSLDVFERDLFAAADGKDGLIIDVRNNGGGWTADRLLASIMVQSHAYTVPRGVDWSVTGHYPQDRLFIQRYTLPANMLCNEKSYSNAEIVAHAFKVLKRGTLVGQQTNGSVISTSGFALIDGTFVRLPLRGWFVDDQKGPGGLGSDMELYGAMPDIIVPQTPESEVADVDEQLKAAVDDLLTRID